MGSSPGAAWLLAHEIRLLWRGAAGGRRRLVAGGALVLWAVLHAAAWRTVNEASLAPTGAGALAAAGIAGWFLLLLAVSSAFSLALGALFERGDLDLLLSAPVRAARVFAVRGLAVAAGAAALPAFLLLPFSHALAARGRWETLASYPLVIAAGLGAAAVALSATVALVHAVGVRRARTLSQVLGALTGAAIFLAAQLPSLLPGAAGEAAAAWGNDLLASPTVAAVLAWPARAYLGEPLPLVLAVMLAVAAFVGSVMLVGRASDAGLLELSGASPRPVPKATGTLATGLARVVIAKELRLIARDPRLVLQALLQGFYLLPLFMLVVHRGSVSEMLAPAVILVCAMLAGNLAWITVSGEEAPDLPGSAPVDARRMRWLKVAAAIVPAVALAAPFLAWYAAQSALAFLAFLACLAGALGVGAVVQVWGVRPQARRDLARRSQGDVFLNVVELAGATGWAGACAALLAGSAWFAAGITVGLLAPVVAWGTGPRGE